MWLFVRRGLSAFIDPFLDQSDLCFSQWRLFVGHLGDALMGALQRLYQQAFFPFAGLERGPILATLQHLGSGIHPQFALLLRSAVAPVAMLGEYRFNLADVVDRGRVHGNERDG